MKDDDELVRQAMSVDDRCFNCNEKRPCKITGTFKHNGNEYPILICQWCRAAFTRHKNKERDGK